MAFTAQSTTDEVLQGVGKGRRVLNATASPPQQASVAPNDAIPRPTFVVLCMASATSAVGFGGLQSVLPAIGREIGIEDSLVAGIFSLAALLVLVFSPIWARQADLRGRKPIIMIGVAGFIVSMFACALVVTAGVHRLASPFVIFVLFLLARGVSGAIGSASPPATQAFVADRTSRETRTQALATLAGTAGFGSIFGPLITPLLAQGPLGLAGPLYAFSVVGVVVLMLIWRLVPSDPPAPNEGTAAAPRHETVALREIWSDPTVRRLLIFGGIVSVLSIGATQTIGFALIDALRLSPMQALPYITGAMVAGSAATVLGQWGIVRWFRMQPHSLLRWGPGLAAVGSIAIIASDACVTMVAGYAVFCLGLSLARPGVSAGASLAVDARAQAGTAGLINALMGAAPLVSPVFLLMYGWARPAPFLVSAAMLGGLLAAALLDRRLRSFHPRR